MSRSRPKMSKAKAFGWVFTVFILSATIGNTIFMLLAVGLPPPSIVDGIFTINDQQISSLDLETFVIETRQLNFKFVATNNGENVSRLWVEIKNRDGTFQLSKFDLDEIVTNVEWTGSYTKPYENNEVIIYLWITDNRVDPITGGIVEFTTYLFRGRIVEYITPEPWGELLLIIFILVIGFIIYWIFYKKRRIKIL